MYKSVLILVVASMSAALVVGINPPEFQPAPAAPEAQASEEEAEASGNATAQDGSLAGNGLASATLMRAPDGHFYAEARVNGAPVRFLVDTGASTVALTRADAQAIGLQFNEIEFNGTAEAAGGTINVKPVTLDRVAVGAIEANNVTAVIGDASLKQSLLGQSWLSRVGTVKIEGERMELR